MNADRPERGVARLVQAARQRPAIALGVVVAVVLGGYAATNALWSSERDVVEEAVQAMLEAAVSGDTRAVLGSISPYFSEGGVTKRTLARHLPRILRKRPITRAGLTVRQAEVTANRAALRIHVTTYGRGARQTKPVGSDWMVRLEYIGGRWLVRSAAPIAVDGKRVAGLWAVLGLGL